MKRAVRNYFIMGFVFLFTLIFIARFAFIDTSTLEDSIWIKPALDIMQGKILFRDTFSGYGMLVPLLQAATLKLFGPYSLSLRLEAAFVYALSIALLFLVWIRFTRMRNALAAVLLWLILMPFYNYILLPWSSVYALDFQAAVLLLLILALNDRNRWFTAFAGASTTLAFLSRQPVGIFLGMAVVGYYLIVLLLKKNGKSAEIIDLTTFVLGGIACFLPFFAYLVLNHAVRDWWIQSFVFAREFAITVRGLSPDQIIKSLFMLRFLKDGTFLQNIIWLLIPLSSIYLLYKAFYEYKKGGLSRKMRLYVLAGLISVASWLQYYPEVGPSHFFWADTPIIGFFIFAVTDLISVYSRRISALFSRFIFVPLVLILFLLIGIYQLRLRSYTASSPVASLKGVKLASYDNAAINAFRTRLGDSMGPHDTYLNLSDDALVTLLDPRFHSIQPLYMQRDFIAAKVYPEFYDRVFSYIISKRPVLVTRTLPYVIGYCSLAQIKYPQPFMQIHIPSERIMAASMVEDTLTLTPKRNLDLISVGSLQTRIKSLTVPNIANLKIATVAADRTGFPVEMKQNGSYPVDLTVSGGTLILYFNDKDIQSCTLNIHSAVK